MRRYPVVCKTQKTPIWPHVVVEGAKPVPEKPPCRGICDYRYENSFGYHIRSCMNCEVVEAEGEGGWIDIP